MATNNKINTTDLTSRLFELIDSMSDKDKMELLKNLEDKKKERARAQLRKLCCMEVNFSDENQTHKGFLHDISDSGAFITTEQLFHLGDKISITMPEFSGIEKYVLVGEIKRIAKDGIGIQFYTDTKETDIKSQIENE
jgi:Tfp pilus assembly protein PilZ